VQRPDIEGIRELIKPENASVVENLVASIARGDASLVAKDALVAEKDALIAQKDQLIAEKDASIDHITSTLADREAQLSAEQAALAENRASLAQRDETLQKVATELETIRHSKGYRLLKGYRSSVRRIFPPGSPSSAVYRTLVRPIDFLLDAAKRSRRR
jgi:uncharacterized protein (DUF3084 family)